MGCFQSKTKEEKEKSKKEGKSESGDKASKKKNSDKHSDTSKKGSGKSSSAADSENSLQVPIPEQQSEPSIKREFSERHPLTSLWYSDEESDSHSSSSSAPVLFRITPVERDDEDADIWIWWHAQVRHEKLSRDGNSKVQLHDLPNRLSYQHDEDPTHVELDMSDYFLERSAPYVLGQLLATPHVRELSYITSIRLDGNYFTDSGFGNMFATIADTPGDALFPVMEELHLSNMNLDASTVSGILSFLFPVDMVAAKRFSYDVPRIPEEYRRPSISASAPAAAPPRPVFPSLKILCLSDNPGLGSEGFATVLNHFLTCHYKSHTLSVLDLSRCQVGKKSRRTLNSFVDDLPVAQEENVNPVIPQRIILIGNPLPKKCVRENCEIRVVF